MEELLDKIEKLKEELNKEEKIVFIKKQLEIIMKNKELINKINNYKKNNNEELKLEIYKNKDYIKYKELENEINLLIFEINSKLKKISKKGNCKI